MKIELLQDTLNRLNHRARNKYPSSASRDLMHISKNELSNLGIKFIKKKRRYGKGEQLDIYDENKLLFKFVRSTYPNNIRTKLGWKICNDKLLTERFLKYSSVKTLDTVVFKEDEFLNALNYVKNSDNKFVIKPSNLMQSLGVFTNVTYDNFTDSWNNCLKLQKYYKIDSPTILVQNQLDGLELRVIVDEGKVSSAALRLPGYVIGDGKSTIKELIESKNELRKLNPYTRGRLIKIDEELNYNLNYRNKNLSTVLKADEHHILYPRTGVINGVEIHEVTHQIKPSVLQQACKAVEAIPGIHTSGVDIFIDSLDADEGVVVEVNKAPAYQLNYYPEYGEPKRPLEYVFESLTLEKKLLSNSLKLEDLTEKDFQILTNRYKFLYNKTYYSEKTILELLNEEK